MVRPRTPLARRLVALVTVAVLIVPLPASAVAPATTCILVPAVPDGSNGWWVTEPAVKLASSQAGWVHYWYDGGSETVLAVTTATPVQIAAPPEGSSVLSAYSVNSAGETETPAGVAKAIRWDITAPSQPTGLAGIGNADDSVDLSWNVSADGGSGIGDYIVYRNETGPPFSSADEIGDAFSNTFTDVPPAGTRTAWYMVQARDVAGNTSADSDAVEVLVDDHPPAVPTGLHATPVFPGDDGATAFDIAWSPVAEAAPVTYEVGYGPGASVPETAAAGAPPLRVAASSESTLWAFTVRTWDAAGNASPASAPAYARNVAVGREWGGDAIATSVAASRAGFASADAVVLVRDSAWPDALSASALAGAVGGPLLLVGPGPLRSDVTGEIARLGARTAYVVGGPAVVSDVTLASAASAAGASARIWGANRYDTAVAVASRVRALRGTPRHVFVVSGENYPDALSVGAAAYAECAPILLARKKSVPAVTIAAVRAAGAGGTVIVGGTAAVYYRAERLLPRATRVWGRNRFDTGRAFGGWAIRNGVLGSTEPVVVTGLLATDGLAGGVLAGRRGSVVLVTSNADAPNTAAWLSGGRGWIRKVRFVGAVTSLSESARYTVWATLSRP